jgi:O-antigen ligase
MGSSQHSIPTFATWGNRARIPIVPIALALLVGVAIGVAVYRFPLPSFGLILAGGLGFTAIVAIAVARYDAAVMLGMCLLGVVNVEPAPPDLIFFVVITIAAVTGRVDVQRLPLIILVSLGTFIALNVLSSVEIVDPGRAAIFFSITLYLAIFAIWLTSYVRSERAARIVLIGYLIACSVSVVLALGALLAGFPGSDLFVFQETRARGLFKDANVFGPFMVPAALILIEEMLKPRLLKLATPLKAALLLLLTLGVIFSFSRAAWLNLGVGVAVLLAVLIMRREGGTRLALVLAVVALAGVATAGLVFATGSDSFLEERASLQGYDSERFGAQEAGLRLAEERPVGIGPGQFESVVNYSAHSTYVRIFAEQGLLGVLAIGVLIISTLVLAARNAAFGRSAYGFGSAALLAAWLGLLVNSLFVDTLHWRHFWLVAALIWVATMRPRTNANPLARGTAHELLPAGGTTR